SAYDRSTIITASIVIPADNGSSDVKIKFALNPPETPANAAASPANGCRPNPAKITAPSGGNTTYTASDATLDITPANTKAAVINCFGTDNTKPRNNALINPVLSAIPIPSIVTNTIPSGAKLMKLSVIDKKICCIPSRLNRFVTSTISPASPGCSTLIPNGEMIAANTTTNNANIAKRVTG